MKVEESLNVTFDESPPPTKLSPLVDEDIGEEDSIRKNTKIELVPLPLSQSVIRTKWVFRKKLDENGIVYRNKAILVAQGYNQQEGIDYDETYALVARLESIRILLAIAFANDFKLYQIDVKSALLNGYKRREDAIFFNQSKYIKEMLKKSRLEDSKPTKTQMSTKMKLTKDDEADSMDSAKYRENPKNTHLEAVKRIFRLVVEFYHSLEVKINELDIPYIEFKLGQFTFTLTPSRLSQILKTSHVLETFYTSEWSLNSLDDHPNSNYFGPKHDIIKKAITTLRTTQAQLLRDLKKLYIDDIHLDLKGWELFFKENLFYSIDKKNKVKACTTYMLYYLTIKRKFNFTLMIIYRMEEVIKKRKVPMPFAMLLTRFYNHLLAKNPQSIVTIARFTFHEHCIDPLDILRNPST
nr:copia protein [Tanacetum cinerariifolium]